MLIQDSEDAKILAGLGLTLVQAQVYLNLTCMGQATIRSIASVSKTDRANAYRIVSTLQSLGLAEKKIANPIVFEAVPLDEGISMLLEKRDRDYALTKKKTLDLVKRYKQNGEVIHADEGSQFVLVPCGKMALRKIKEMIDTCQESHELIFCWKDLASEIDGVIYGLSLLLKKGVRLRVLIFIEGSKQPSECLLDLKKYGSFELRYTPTKPTSTLSIYDLKEAFITVVQYLSPTETASLWISNTGLIDILKDYFNMVWDNSTSS